MAIASFRTSDVDDMNAKTNEVFYESATRPVGQLRGSYRFEMKYALAGPITFAVLSHSCEIDAKVGGLDMTYSVGIPLKGAFPLKFGSTDVTADPSTAAVATPTSQIRYRGFPTGTEQLFVLTFDKEQLHNHLRNLLGRDGVEPINLAPSMSLRKGRAAEWWRMTSTLALELQSSSGFATNPMMTAPLSSTVMTGLLLSTDHQYRDELDAWTRPLPPAAIRRAAEIIESRAHEPLTIPEIAAEIGCSVTALQVGYRKHLNMTPREHIGRVRMDRAHAMLQYAHPGSASVADIAAKAGFRHTGRFAAKYRKTYGVLPHVTLREG